MVNRNKRKYMSSTFVTIEKEQSKACWIHAQQSHKRRLEPIVEPHLERASRGEKHPVIDFLFEYYSFKPSHLYQWSPGAGVLLQDTSLEEITWIKELVQTEEGCILPVEHFPNSRRKGLAWVLSLLKQTQSRAPHYSCAGMHEWAMVFEKKDIRHPQLGLRLPHQKIKEIVSSFPLRCTHYDAFRFFSASARPLNTPQLTPENRAGYEQPGCIHANMDVYRWAYKFHPWVPSELIAEAFFCALEAREIDMRASPYDVRALGYDPIEVETVQGRQQYGELQHLLYKKAFPIRERLIQSLENLMP